MSTSTSNDLAKSPAANTRSRKPTNPSVARAKDQHGAGSDVSSPGVSPPGTPKLGPDAPPSAQATSAVRRQRRKETKEKKRIFPSIDYHPRLSYFDPNSDYSNFRGFFVLFWIGLAIMVITTMLRNLKEVGVLLNFKQWHLFTENIVELGISDALMCATTAIDLPLNKLYLNSRGWLRWDKAGMTIQSIVQATWLAFWVTWPFARDWTWTAQVFFTLHILTLFMKMHSYAFYSGHLSVTHRQLRELDQAKDPNAPTPAAVHYPSAHLHEEKRSGEFQRETGKSYIDSQDHVLPPVLQLREELARELTSPMGNVTYPQNLTLHNFVDYMLCPTLCYELEYPRNEKRSWLELFYKVLAIFGIIFLLTIISDEFIIPILGESSFRLRYTKSWEDFALVFAETVSSLLFPFMVVFLLVFLVIFEYVLGAFAEITRFADRRFYSDWWNSQDWMEFSREWNIPVHNFLGRHVYSASRMANMSKPLATVLTFVISALAHELVMGCITRKFRGYGFVLMMMQMPIVMLQKTPFVQKRELLNNIMFWICMILGLSLLCALYVLI